MVETLVCMATSDLSANELVEGFRSICDELIQLVKFVALNAEGVRKVMLFGGVL